LISRRALRITACQLVAHEAVNTYSEPICREMTAVTHKAIVNTDAAGIVCMALYAIS